MALHVDALKASLREQFLCDNFYLLLYMRKNGQFLCDKYICWEAGVSAFMWQIKIVPYEKLLV